MKPKLLAVSATDTVPAILCVAATGSDPAQGSDTSVAAAMLSSKLFFDGAGTHRPLPERKAGHISVLSGGSSADGAGVAGMEEVPPLWRHRLFRQTMEYGNTAQASAEALQSSAM